METCFADITVEFLAVAFHSILYYASIYPKSIFETRRKYSVVVYHSIHPEVNRYIELCLKAIAECLRSEQLTRVEFSITNDNYTPLVNFIFEFEKNISFNDTADAYLIQCEQNLRAYCLKLASISDKLKTCDNASFSVFIHTNESIAISMSVNPDLDEIPLVEVEGISQEQKQIIPLRKFTLKNYNLDTYVEI